ncbi:DoxX family protein [Paenibacillus sp. SAF-054]|uniref:DoxX family protein n=1 Tax=unclassified Paenibacillus TaxID=185978 RepID=UPI003F7EE353
MIILSVILQSFLLVTMTFAGSSKLAGGKNFVEMFESLKLPQWFRVVTGIVQLAGAVGLLLGYWHLEAATWAGIWIGITMIVACLLHLRIKHPFSQWMPSIIITLIAAALVLVNQFV